MRKSFFAVAALATAMTLGVAGCGGGSDKSDDSSTNNKVGILLPDTASSPRWVSADPNELSKQCTPTS